MLKEVKKIWEKNKREKMARIDMSSNLIQPHLSFSFSKQIPTSHNCPSLNPFFISHSFCSLSPTFMGFFGFSHPLRVRPREDYNALRTHPPILISITICLFGCSLFSFSLKSPESDLFVGVGVNLQVCSFGGIVGSLESTRRVSLAPDSKNPNFVS